MRNLTRRGVASSFLKDMGRQRVTCFVARRFATKSVTKNEIADEKKKFEELLRPDEDVPIEPEKDLPVNPPEDEVVDGQSVIKSEDAPAATATTSSTRSLITDGGIEVEVSETTSATIIFTPKKKSSEPGGGIANAHTVRSIQVI